MIADEFDSIRRRLEEIWKQEQRRPLDLGDVLKRQSERQREPDPQFFIMPFPGPSPKLLETLAEIERAREAFVSMTYPPEREQQYRDAFMFVDTAVPGSDRTVYWSSAGRLMSFNGHEVRRV